MMRFASVCSIFGKVGKCLRSRILCQSHLYSIRVFIKKNRHSEANRRIQKKEVIFVLDTNIQAVLYGFSGWARK